MLNIGIKGEGCAGREKEKLNKRRKKSQKVKIKIDEKTEKIAEKIIWGTLRSREEEVFQKIECATS